MMETNPSEFDAILAEKISESVGSGGETWLVFDMDGTLADLKGSVVIRPTLRDFFNAILEKDIRIYFGIYSNNHSAENVDFVTREIEKLVGSHPLFHVCFKLHNFHKFRGEIPGVKMENVQLQIWDKDKTYSTIAYAYSHCDHPITDPTHVYFFDDRTPYSVRSVIGENYIHVIEYKSSKMKTIKNSRGTKRKLQNNKEKGERGENRISKKRTGGGKRHYRKTQGRNRRERR